MTTDQAGFLLAAASAFCGALGGAVCVGFWIASKIGAIYKTVDARFGQLSTAFTEHEKEDIQRFADLKLLILDHTLQTQIVEGWRVKAPTGS